MKSILAVIRPHKLEDVKKALIAAGILGLTVREVRGFGKQKGFVEHYRASETLVNLLPKIEVEVAVRDADLDKALSTIVSSAKTGEVGDGKIFVYDVAQVIRIRTGEKGEAAL